MLCNPVTMLVDIFHLATNSTTLGPVLKPCNLSPLDVSHLETLLVDLEQSLAGTGGELRSRAHVGRASLLSTD